MASLRSLKRTRVSYDDTDPMGSHALVSASLGMFSASEHCGLYDDVCQLAEILLWGKGERGSLREVRLVFIASDEVTKDLLGAEVTELFSAPEADRAEIRYESENGLVATMTPEEGYTLHASSTKLESSGTLGGKRSGHISFYAGEFHTTDPSMALAGYLLEIPAPVALKHLTTWYVFDSPCVYRKPPSKPGVAGEPCAALRCSALGDQSPVLSISGAIPLKAGCWSLLLDMVQPEGAWKALDFKELARLARCSESGEDITIHMQEQSTGAGRAFVNSWQGAMQRNEPIELQVLWGAVSADFWDRVLNVAQPWGTEKLGSYAAEEGVDGSLLETGASMLSTSGLGLMYDGKGGAGESHRTDNFELVALGSLRFMRDTSVAYPTAIVTFDAGSSGWALEMFDSCAVNAIELAFYLLGGHFQL